jgi:hypothetical protein
MREAKRRCLVFDGICFASGIAYWPIRDVVAKL